VGLGDKSHDLKRTFPLVRVPWALVSTATSSIGSFVLSLAMLRSGSTVSFAYFGIVFTYYAFVLNLNRAVAGSPTILLFSGRDASAQRTAASLATLNSLALGVIATVLAAAMIPILAGEHRGVLFAGVAFLPGLLAQDTIRYAYFTRREPRGAAIADLMWTVLQVVLFLALVLSNADSPVLLFLAWGFAGSFAAGLMAVAFGIRLSTGQAWRALQEQRGTIAPLVVEMGALGIVDFLISIIIAVLGSATILGDYRAGALLVAPFNVLLASVMLTVVPNGVFRHEAGLDFKRMLVRAAGVVVAAALLLGLAAGFLPTRIGTAIFGLHWSSMHALLPVWIFTMTAIGLSTIAFAGLRILRRLKLAMVIRLMSLPITAALVGAGVRLDGAGGAVVGYGVAVILGGLAALYFFTRRGRTLWA
jgi:O-antigen/teichoic acid export membrane protein